MKLTRLCFFFCAAVVANAACQPQHRPQGIDPLASDLPQAINSQTRTGFMAEEDGETVNTLFEVSNIGRRGKNRVEVKCSRALDEEIVKIDFYSKRPDESWRVRQSLNFKKDGGPPCDPKVEDFNNDGSNDLTFISGQAARGANEIRTLLIYDKKRDELVHIRNSAEYPNLAYNSALDCIDAWSFYGGTATIFLRLKGDMLEEFASVEDFPPTRTVTVRDREGRSLRFVVAH